jgi:hypothetical protein
VSSAVRGINPDRNDLGDALLFIFAVAAGEAAGQVAVERQKRCAISASRRSSGKILPFEVRALLRFGQRFAKRARRIGERADANVGETFPLCRLDTADGYDGITRIFVQCFVLTVPVARKDAV